MKPYVAPKSVKSTASKGQQVNRTNAPRQGSNSETKSGKGHFAGAMLRLAKLRSKSRSEAPLQVGNVLTKKAPQGGSANFDSRINKPEGKQFANVNSTEGQTALNPKQQGKSNKNMQRSGRNFG